MARKNRKEDIVARNAGVVRLVETAQPQSECYGAAIYARLSIFETRDREDSQALQNQKELLLKYVQAHPELRLYAVYEDNGETGTNFERSDFQRMMADVKAGKVNCIIVKDLSRFGRNHLEAGNYLEHVFPFLGVRLIAINDGYDSIDPSSGNILKAALKNLINEAYSKDISRKSGSVLREKQRRGEFIGAWAAYGYLKDPADKHRIMIDEETAPIVREIFARKLAGESNVSIARGLNERGISTPTRYRYEKGIVKGEHVSENTLWRTTTIKTILTNGVYTGDLVQGRRVSEFYAGRTERRKAQEDWVVVENTHEAIIDRQTFDAVQGVLAERKQEYHERLGKYDSLGTHENILKGLVYCGDCGRTLTRYKQVSHGKKVSYYYLCPYYELYLGQSGCTKKNIPEDTLLEAVRQSLRHEFALAADMETLLKTNKGVSPAVAAAKACADRLAQSQRQTETIRNRLMCDYLSDILTKDEYDRMKLQYDKKAETLAAQLETALQEVERLENRYTAKNAWFSALHSLTDIQELGQDTLRTLIQKIVIHTDNRVEIFYNFSDEKAALMHQLSLEEVSA